MALTKCFAHNVLRCPVCDKKKDEPMASNSLDIPVSIGELKAKRSGNAHDWTPRDCLVDMLRAIDAGELNPDGLIVCVYNAGEDGMVDIKFSQAMPNVLMASGTLQRVQNLLGK